jgi:hypothetical protein
MTTQLNNVTGQIEKIFIDLINLQKLNASSKDGV